MKLPPIIGIAGKAGAGKDTLGDFLRGHIVRSYIYSFAEPIKRGLQYSLGYGDDEMYGNLKEVTDADFGFSPRAAMQEFGTCLRNLNPDIWFILASMKHKMSPSRVMIIPDVRYDNEANWIRSKGGITIQIERPGIQDVREHSSEKGISEHLIDHLLINDVSLDDLRQSASEILENYSAEEVS